MRSFEAVLSISFDFPLDFILALAQSLHFELQTLFLLQEDLKVKRTLVPLVDNRPKWNRVRSNHRWPEQKPGFD